MIWSWLHRRPQLVDLAIAVAVWLPTVAVATRRPHPVATALLVTLGTLPLLRRRQAPLAVVGATTAVAVAIIALGSPLVPLQLGVALYTLAARGESRTRRGLGLAAVAVVATALTIASGDDEFGSTAFHVVFLIASWLLGDAIGSRRAYVQEIEQKAERLERERLTESRRVVAEEQARIGRELHDVVAHALSVIVVQAGAAEEVFELDPALARAPIRAIDKAARAALADLRRVLGVVSADAGYEPQPGLARLDGLIDQVRATGLDVALEIEGSPATPARDRRSLRVPHHPGGAHEHAQARGRPARAGERQVRPRSATADPRRRSRRRAGQPSRQRADGNARACRDARWPGRGSSLASGGYVVTAEIPLGSDR